jgi:hypothetical protein
MSYNAKCWKRQAVSLAAAMTFLSGCGAVGFDRQQYACPPVVDYNRAEQARVAHEVAQLPESSLIIGWLADYAVLREQARTCHRPL